MARCWPPATSSSASRRRRASSRRGISSTASRSRRSTTTTSWSRPAIRAFAQLAEAFGRIGLRQRDRAASRAEAERAWASLARARRAPEGGAAKIEAALAAFDPATEEGRDRLHRLLERQHYRLAWWRAAADEINWRRFFDITSLAGFRVEVPEAFDDSHELVLRLYAEGVVDGVRIDHVDGLADPRGYCRKLYRRMQSVRPDRAPLIWVEKILAPFEALRTDWMVDGTSGYDFMDEASGRAARPGRRGAALRALDRDHRAFRRCSRTRRARRGGRSCGRTWPAS